MTSSATTCDEISAEKSPELCCLCNAVATILPCGFRQIYPQKALPAVLVHWWECRRCGGWFADPIPSAEEIERYWQTVPWISSERAGEIAQGKYSLQSRILDGMSRLAPVGPLLDIGCNFGHFLRRAAQAGWIPSGFEPNIMAAEIARANGFDIRSGWSLQAANFTESHFAAVTAIDVFSYAWRPFETLQAIYRLLRPGGVIAMRITNKRFVLGLARNFTAAGSARNSRISSLLQGQFHSVELNSLRRIMEEIGFRSIRVEANALAVPWGSATRRTRTAYAAANIAFWFSFGRLNVNPGVLLFAIK